MVQVLSKFLWFLSYEFSVVLVSVKNKTMVKYDCGMLYILSSFICGLP